MNAVEIAIAIAHSDGSVRRDPTSGLYTVGDPDDGIVLTLAQYEAGMRVLALREKAALAGPC